MRGVLLVLALLAGCAGRFGIDGADDGADAGSWQPRSPRAAACRELAEATCARYAACAPAAARFDPGTGDVCVTAWTEHCLRTAGLGGPTRTDAHVRACAEGLPALTCDALLARYPSVCDPPAGTLVDGAACAFDEQCASLFCARPLDAACGSCARAPTAGEACFGGRCGARLVCNTASRCARPAEVGEPCDPSTPCSSLLFCDGSACRRKLAVGEACGGLGQCDPAAALVCSETYRCREATSARAGEPCSFTANALTLCEAPARCIADRCAAAKPAGAACTQAHECAGLLSECIRGRCVVRTVEDCAQK